jgi:hypothetical protein
MTSESLRDCVGYQVETHQGRLGDVAAIVPSRSHEETGVVIVHSGPSCALSVVSMADVESVDVAGRRLAIRNKPVGCRRDSAEGQAVSHLPSPAARTAGA